MRRQPMALHPSADRSIVLRTTEPLICFARRSLKPAEPAIQKVVVELLHQLPFRADPIEDVQQQGTQQLLRRDRWASLTRIKLSEADAEFLQHRSNEPPDLPQRMPRRHPCLW